MVTVGINLTVCGERGDYCPYSFRGTLKILTSLYIYTLNVSSKGCKLVACEPHVAHLNSVSGQWNVLKRTMNRLTSQLLKLLNTNFNWIKS